jgi:hypothetical protein
VLSALFAIFDAHPEAGFVGPRVDDPEGGSFSGAFRFPTLMTEVAKGLGIGALLRQFPTVIDETDAPVEVDWITGSACLIRGAAFEVLGDMDDGYFLYFDEVDYMLQGRRLGWTTWHAPDARVIHDAGAATGIAHGQARRGRQPGLLVPGLGAVLFEESWPRLRPCGRHRQTRRNAGGLCAAAHTGKVGQQGGMVLSGFRPQGRPRPSRPAASLGPRRDAGGASTSPIALKPRPQEAGAPSAITSL